MRIIHSRGKYTDYAMQQELIHVQPTQIQFEQNRGEHFFNAVKSSSRECETLYLIIRKISWRSIITIHNHVGDSIYV